MVSPLHDLNTADSRNAEMDGIVEDETRTSEVDGIVEDETRTGEMDEVVEGDTNNTTDSLEEEDGTHSTSYDHSLQLQDVSIEADQSAPIDGGEPPRSPYGVLTVADVSPIEGARARFLQILLSNFITAHVTPTSEFPEPCYYGAYSGKDKLKKRKARDIQFEGDPKYVLPLAYVANLYETLVNEINARLATVDGLHERTMGVALEAAGGLYRRLVKLYPKSGGRCNFKRREMASALEARSRFPHLVSGDEKRVRFIVVHGLELVERPYMPDDDAEWFKRLTGRHEVAVFERDYKFFAPRHKYRRSSQHPLVLISSLLPHHSIQHQAHAIEYIQEHQAHLSQISPVSYPEHSFHHGTRMTEASHVQHISAATHRISQGVHPSSILHGSRIVVMPAKYCDECGTPYLRETSKYCSECGTKRLMLGSQSM